MSRYQKDISLARKMQDDYALAERRYEKSRAKKRNVGRRSDEALGRQWMEKNPHLKTRAEKRRGAKGSTSSQTKNEGRVEGFLAGAFVTALAWLVKGSK
mgnify:CR=1 FL=1